MAGSMVTRSPGTRCFTSEPTSITVAEGSCPSTNGLVETKCATEAVCHRCKSVPHIPVECDLRRHSEIQCRMNNDFFSKQEIKIYNKLYH